MPEQSLTIIRETITLSREDAIHIICTVADQYAYFGSQVEKELWQRGLDTDSSKEFVESLRKLPIDRLERLLLFLSN